jgi:hypothetical protein
MRKTWACCVILAVLGLVGLLGNSTFAGITPVNDSDAAKLTGGQNNNCPYYYWSLTCSGCGQKAIPPCPYSTNNGYCIVVYSLSYDPCGTYAYSNYKVVNCQDCGSNDMYTCGYYYDFYYCQNPIIVASGN